MKKPETNVSGFSLVAPPSRWLSGGRPAHTRGQDALQTAG